MLIPVLVSTRNPLNLGAAARACSNFGFTELRVVNPYDIAFREARSAVGAADLLKSTREYPSVPEAVSDCHLVVGTTAATNRDLQQPLRSLPAAAEDIKGRASSGDVALLFGSEKRGLTNEDLAHCHYLVRIPTREVHASMNLGQAVAICLYEIARGMPTPVEQHSKAATAGQAERITKLLYDALEKSGYVKPSMSDVTEEKIRRMIRRFALHAEDAHDLQGMLRKITYRLRGRERSPRSD